MRGHTLQRGKSWSYVIDIGRDEAGKRRQQWKSGFRTKKEAQIACTEVLNRLQQNTYIAPTKQSLAAYLADWLKATKQEVRPSTWASYELNCRRHIVPALGNIPLQQVSPGAIGHLYSELLEKGRTDGKGGLSPQTVKYIAMILKHALADAVTSQRLTRNPADGVKAARPSRGVEMRTWTAKELLAFIEHVSDEPLSAAFVVAGTTGMRRGEILGLRWSDVDLERSRVSIQQTLLAVGYEIQFSSPKTARGRRSVSIGSETVTALRQHRIRQNEIRLQLGSGYRSDLDLVFARVDGEPLHPERLTRTFERLVKAAGLPHIRFHDLRHTAASIMLSAGVPAKVASERLGHANISITLDTYSHVLPGLQEDAAEKIAAAIYGGR